MGRIGAEGSYPDASRRRASWHRRGVRRATTRRRCLVRRRGAVPHASNADASLAPTSGFDAATTRAALSGVGAEGSVPSTPPNADASLAPTSGFDAATTRAALPGFGAEGSVPSTPPNADASLAPTSGFDAATTRAALPGVGAEGIRTLDASKRRCLLGTDEWVRRSHHEGGFAWFRRRGDPYPRRLQTPMPPWHRRVGSTQPPRRAALPGFGAEGTAPSTPPNADASLAPTSGFGVVDPKVTKPEPGTGVISTSASARVATVFLILRKPVPWRKRRMASSGRGAPLPRRTLWPAP